MSRKVSGTFEVCQHSCMIFSISAESRFDFEYLYISTGIGSWAVAL